MARLARAQPRAVFTATHQPAWPINPTKCKLVGLPQRAPGLGHGGRIVTCPSHQAAWPINPVRPRALGLPIRHYNGRFYPPTHEPAWPIKPARPEFVGLPIRHTPRNGRATLPTHVIGTTAVVTLVPTTARILGLPLRHYNARLYVATHERSWPINPAEARFVGLPIRHTPGRTPLPTHVLGTVFVPALTPTGARIIGLPLRHYKGRIYIVPPPEIGTPPPPPPPPARTFTPPALDDGPPIAYWDRKYDKGEDRITDEWSIQAANPKGFRLMSYYKQRPVSVTIFKMSDGTYAADRPIPGLYLRTVPYTTIPVESSTDGTPSQVNNVISMTWLYGQVVSEELQDPSVVATYQGGHTYVVSAEEADALIAAGLGAYVT